MQDQAFQAGLSRYEKGIAQMESATDRGAGAMTKAWNVAQGAVVVGAAAAVAGLASIVAVSKQGLDSLISWGDQVNKLSDTLGTTGEQSSTFAVALNTVGVSVDEGAAGLNFFVRGLDDLKNVQTGATATTAKSSEAIAKLNERLGDAQIRLQRAQKALSESKKPTDAMRNAVDDAQKAVNRLNAEIGAAGKLVPVAAAKLSPFQQALKDLGVRAFDAKGKLRTFDEILPDLLDAFQKMPPGIKKSALAMDLFGSRAGTKFIDFLSQGSEGLKEAKQLAEDFGLTISTDLSNATEDFTFSLNRTNLGLQGFWVTIGKEVLPIATRFVDFINRNVLPPLIKWAREVMPPLFAQVGKFGDWLNDIGIPTLKAFVEGIVSVVRSFVRFMQTGEIFEDFAADLAAVFGGKTGAMINDFIIGVVHALRRVGISLQLIFNALRQGDWAGAWKVFAKGVQHIWDFVQPILAQFASQFWTWLTGPGGAIDQGKAKLGELVTAVSDFLKENGPKAWAALQTWGTDIWTWLTEDALPKVAEMTGTLLKAIGNWLQNMWDTYVAPLVGIAGTWAGLFWDWLTGAGGAMDMIGGKLIEFGTQLLAASQREDVKANVRGTGKSIGLSIANGIADFFESGEGQTASDNAFAKLIHSFEEADRKATQAIFNIGREFVEGIFEGIRSGEAARVIYGWLNIEADKLIADLPKITKKIADAFVGYLTANFTGGFGTDFINAIGSAFETWIKGGLPGLVFRIVSALVQQFNQALKDLGLGGLFDASTTGGTTSGGTTTQQAATSTTTRVQTVPISLQVKIGEQEIKEAVLTWSYEGVNTLFNEAVAQVTGMA